MKTVLVTGANGFVGRPLCAHLRRNHWRVIASLRGAVPPPELTGCSLHHITELGVADQWDTALAGTDIVVHLAARVHFLHDPAPRPVELYRRINTEATLALARAAARHGVSRFVFTSTIGVNGQRTDSGPFSESDAAHPTTPYSLSKWEAEQGLAEIARATGMQVVIIRPPLVYGPWVKGNFLRLMRLVDRRFPLPLASIANLRSFIYVGNLVSAIEKLLPAALPPIATYLVSDDHDLSLPQILRDIGAAMNVEPRLLPFPPWLLMIAGRLTGKSEEVHRLVESLRVDCSRIKHDLGWSPPFSPAAGIAETVRWFLHKPA